MESTALALAERPMDVPATHSPIGRMIVILEHRQAAEPVTTHFGAVRWDALPIRHVLAEAAALVIDAVGQRQERVAQTIIDARKIADQTETRLNVGLLLAHGSAEKAAIAFEKTMRDAVDAAAKRYLSRMPTDPPMDAASVWTRPAYLFLVACAKRGREEGERLRATVDRLSARNARAVRGAKICETLSGMSVLVSCLETGSEFLTAKECEQFASFPSGLVAYEAILETGICALRPEIDKRGRHLKEYPQGLFHAWICTAVLKVALGDKDVSPGAISHAAAFKAQARLRDLDFERVADTVAAVAHARSASLPERQRAIGEHYVWREAFSHAKFLARAEHGHGPNPDEHFIDQELANDGGIVLTHERALEYLDRDEIGTGGYMDYSPETVLAIENGLDWESFDAEDFENVFSRGRLPMETVIRHLGALRPKTRESAVDWILEGHPELINDLVASGHLPWTASIGTKYAKHLPPELLVRSLREQLSEETAFFDRLGDYVSLMLRVPPDALAEIWNDPRNHEQLVAFLECLLFEGRRSKIDPKDEAKLAERAGSTLERYAMEAYAGDRSGNYGDPDATAKNVTMPAWEDTSGSDELTEGLRILLGPRLPALLAEHTEEECFARLVARRPNAKRLIAEFAKGRKRFFGKK